MGLNIRASGLRATARFTLADVSADPERPHALHVRRLSLDNPTLLSERFKRARAQGASIDELDLNQWIADLSRHGVESWENIEDDGAALPCTPENVERYLRAVAESVEGGAMKIMGIWRRAHDPVEYGGAPLADPVDVGKESPPG